jgi:lipopolysaccharide/colanic/teichoic acid biosynthesis glycosyltransferase
MHDALNLAAPIGVPKCGLMTANSNFAIQTGGSSGFWMAKRLFDVVASVLALPIVGCFALSLIFLNPIWNPGAVFFRQKRMGRGGRPMTVWKFRTMGPASDGVRGAADPLEHERITPLGGLLRRTRIDELPQILNVLVGEMSLIGPRPDCLDHALDFLPAIPGYGFRYAIRPGISGYAQVRLGYAEGYELTAEKTRLDLTYIRNAGWKLELAVLWRTFVVLTTGYGAR